MEEKEEEERWCKATPEVPLVLSLEELFGNSFPMGSLRVVTQQAMDRTKGRGSCRVLDCALLSVSIACFKHSWKTK